MYVPGKLTIWAPALAASSTAARAVWMLVALSSLTSIWHRPSLTLPAVGAPSDDAMLRLVGRRDEEERWGKRKLL